MIAGKSYRVSDLSFEDLHFRYATGVAIKSVGDKGSKASGYRHGVMTSLGDLEIPLWESLIRDLIHRSGEDDLLSALTNWAENTPWLRSRREVELYALELHSSRIFDNPKWVAYEEFNKKYRPKCLNNQEVTHESEKENA